MSDSVSSANSLFRSLLKYTATLGFIGYIPFAPGTWGSLAGLISFILIMPSLQTQLLIIIIGVITGIYASSVAEKALDEKDSRRIVIDELIGFYVSVFYLPQRPGYLIMAFLLFRFFDIIKPLPIKKLEKALHGGSGVMADDIMAGIYANIILQIWIKIS